MVDSLIESDLETCELRIDHTSIHLLTDCHIFISYFFYKIFSIYLNNYFLKMKNAKINFPDYKQKNFIYFFNSF